MDAARAAVVTGTVLHLESHVVAVPTGPPAPSGLPRDEGLREQFLAVPGWSPDDAESSALAPRGDVLENLRAGSPSVVELEGPDLPADAVRAQLRGTITGQRLQVESWRPEPEETSVWAAPRVTGTDPGTADGIVDSVPEHWPLVSVGVSATATGRHVVMLEVLHVTPEIRAWYEGQPPGAVQLDTFVDLAPAPDSSAPLT